MVNSRDVLSASIALFLAIVLFGCGNRPNNPNENRINQLAYTIKNSSDVDIQLYKSEELFDILSNINCNDMGGKALNNVISLLDLRHDGVRYWVVRSLDQIGPCAKAAIPKLKQIVPQADCWPGGKTSASDIRATLKRFGEPSPPETICTNLGEGYAKSQ